MPSTRLIKDYLGQRQEAELGLYYYVARWYDPAIGRFIQADTIVPNPASAKGFDRYAYVGNNPINYADPTGHMEDGACGLGLGNDSCGTYDGGPWPKAGHPRGYYDAYQNSLNLIKARSKTLGEDIKADSGGAHYLHGMSESELAGHQCSQGQTQYCGVYSGVTALSILSGNNYDPSTVSSAIEDSPLGGFPVYNIGLENGSLIPQTALLITRLGEGDYIAVPLEIPYISPEIMEYYLSDPEMVLIVSLTWMTSSRPDIYHGDSRSPARLDPGFGGHFMIFAAHDPYHTNNGTSTPYGFINSWTNGGNNIYWMSEDDFSTTWGQYSVFSSIIVRKIP